MFYRLLYTVSLYLFICILLPLPTPCSLHHQIIIVIISILICTLFTCQYQNLAYYTNLLRGKGNGISTATQGNLTLDQKTASSHLLWLLQAHSLEDRRRDIAEDTVGLLQGPAFGGVGHDEGNFVGCVGGLGLAVFEFHFFGVAVIYN